MTGIRGITVETANDGGLLVRLDRTADWTGYDDESGDIHLTRLDALRLAAELCAVAAPRNDLAGDIRALLHTWEQQGRK